MRIKRIYRIVRTEGQLQYLLIIHKAKDWEIGLKLSYNQKHDNWYHYYYRFVCCCLFSQEVVDLFAVVNQLNP